MNIFISKVEVEVPDILFSLWIAFQNPCNDLASYGSYAEMSALSNGVLKNKIACLFHRENWQQTCVPGLMGHPVYYPVETGGGRLLGPRPPSYSEGYLMYC